MFINLIYSKKNKLYEINNEDLKKEYYELRGLILNNLDRIQDDKESAKNDEDVGNDF